MNKIGGYKNGNYNVILFDDGTKIRVNNDTYMRADRPESIDIDISDRCYCNCDFCYQGCTPGGAIADFNAPIFDTILPYTEIALNGNGVIGTVEFEDFLFKMARKKVICNITLHLHDFINHIQDIQYCVDHGLLHGIGVSINDEINEEIAEKLMSFFRVSPNIVIHVIAGVVPWKTLVALGNRGLKLLILGYKNYGRGEVYFTSHNEEVEENINILEDRWAWLLKSFKVVSFDNLALEQLHVKECVSKEDWERYYMGDDGSATFYIDAVKNTYACSSISERKPIDVQDVNILFRRVQDERY